MLIMQQTAWGMIDVFLFWTGIEKTGVGEVNL